ncbi:MAG: hypothetical protein GX795_07345 [Firmicutes bacterium]|nr:hypothetical protein [Bacillota bacterium]
MKRWWSLVKKEWRSSWTIILLALVAVSGFDVWLAFKAPVWSAGINGGLAIGLSFIPFAGIGIATYVIGYLIMRYEWRDRTSLRLLSYPASGAGIISAKLLVAVLALGLIAVVAAAGTWLVAQRSLVLPPDILQVTEDILQLKPWERTLDIMWLVACLILGAAFIIAVGVFSFVIGTIAPRVSGLIAVIVYGLVGYLTSAFAPHAMYVFSFVPNPGLIVYRTVPRVREVIPLLPFWPTLIGTIALVWAAGKILESEVDA